MRWNNDVIFYDRDQAAQEARHKALSTPIPQHDYPAPDRSPAFSDVHTARSGLRFDDVAEGDRRGLLDAERDVVLKFVAKYPEYDKLGHDGVVQALATMRTPAEHDVDNAARDAGVVHGPRADWRVAA